MTDQRMSLDEFLESSPRDQRAFVFSLPEEIRAQLDAHRKRNTTVKTMVDWLKTIGYENATQGKLEHYFKCYGEKA